MGHLLCNYSFFSKGFVRCLCVVHAVRSVEVIEALRFAQFSFEIEIAFVAEQLVELLPV